MPIRDIVVTLAILWTIPHILKAPWIGILAWSWLAFMSPHRLCWGFAYGLPFSMIIGITVLYSFSKSDISKKMVWTSSTVLMMAFFVWMVITTIFADYPSLAWAHFDKIWKVFLMTFVTILVMQDKRHLHLLVAVIAMSVGFYGIKGGIFTIRSGGGEMVLGPRGSFMATHGEIGMGMAMTLPYLRYLQLHATNMVLIPKPLRRFLPQQYHRLIRLGFGLSIFLTGLAILGTQSRGAMLAGAMVVAFLILKSRQKFRMIFLLVLIIPLMLTFMPQKWWDRMNTISTDESQLDASSTGRINAWTMAYNLANHQPLGGGYQCFQWGNFAKYAPNPEDLHDAHSIYFEVLAEHGWVGLTLFMALAMMTWFKASKIARRAKRHQSLWWLSDLARMSQVSLAAYAASGAFIGQSYFDLYYAVIAIVVISDLLLTRELKRIEAGEQDDKPIETGNKAPNRSWKAYGSPQLRPLKPPR